MTDEQTAAERLAKAVEKMEAATERMRAALALRWWSYWEKTFR